ncbi:MAG: LysR family transcriptional regulator [Bacteriovoracia bacterium]
MLEDHLEKLVAFIGVADAGSIRSYAVSHRLSQPGVSQRITALEKQLGLPLFHRSRSGIRLTAPGRRLYQFGQQVIAQSKQVEAQLYRGQARETELKIGTYDSVAIYLMPNVIAEAQRRLPHLKLALTCDRSASVVKQIEAGTLDCGLCMVMGRHTRLEAVPLFSDRFGFYLRPGSQHTDEIITVPDASDQNGKTVSGHLRTFANLRARVLEVPSFEIAKAMTLAGLGIGVLPERVADPEVRQGHLRRAPMPSGVPASFGTHHFAFIRRKNSPEFPALQVFIDILRTEIKRKNA